MTMRLEAAARQVRVPTLLVRGKQSDVVSPEGASQLLAMIPHASCVDVEGAGHMVAGDRNDIFNASILDFLDGLQRSD
ncbi:3-oxoadipate enol-lactonase [compost metagenome]